eukprot:Gregarina_sp_Poly_1__10304@NODE_726_length_6582_cov_72_170837_g544_i0_p3_GENE_NODE_726_length_6582_cov_72_170837_g544_i0NODE_726_length_6582_cov_72_170837_g544_i0_p3_ORF_typecomplete_len358_score6_37_NODE_726_length_6582_cov_72_170837_g544_i026483721
MRVYEMSTKITMERGSVILTNGCVLRSLFIFLPVEVRIRLLLLSKTINHCILHHLPAFQELDLSSIVSRKSDCAFLHERCQLSRWLAECKVLTFVRHVKYPFQPVSGWYDRRRVLDGQHRSYLALIVRTSRNLKCLRVNAYRSTPEGSMYEKSLMLAGVRAPRVNCVFPSLEDIEWSCDAGVYSLPLFLIARGQLPKLRRLHLTLANWYLLLSYGDFRLASGAWPPDDGGWLDQDPSLTVVISIPAIKKINTSRDIAKWILRRVPNKGVIRCHRPSSIESVRLLWEFAEAGWTLNYLNPQPHRRGRRLVSRAMDVLTSKTVNPQLLRTHYVRDRIWRATNTRVMRRLLGRARDRPVP